MAAPVYRALLGAAISALAICWHGPTQAQEADKTWQSMLAISVHAGISTEEMAALLTLGRSSEYAEPTLVRWDQDEVTLGLTVSRNASGELVDAVVSGIQQRFASVNRHLTVCIRSWPNASEMTDPIDECGPGPTEIDVLVSVQDRALPDEIEALPSDSSNAFLKDTWSRIRREVLAQPDWHFCNFGFATDTEARRLAGAAGIVWIPPTDDKKTLELAENCARNLGFDLLGSLPILDKSGEGGTLSPDLLALLYSDDFRSGETRSEVLATLQKAQPY